MVAPDASDDDVRAAAEAASAADFLDALPEGFATFLGEKGRALVRWATPTHRNRPCDLARSESAYS